MLMQFLKRICFDSSNIERISNHAIRNFLNISFTLRKMLIYCHFWKLKREKNGFIYTHKLNRLEMLKWHKANKKKKTVPWRMINCINLRRRAHQKRILWNFHLENIKKFQMKRWFSWENTTEIIKIGNNIIIDMIYVILSHARKFRLISWDCMIMWHQFWCRKNPKILSPRRDN